MFKNKKIIIGIIVGAAALLFLFYFGAMPSAQLGAPRAIYSHPAFGVSLAYPEHWAVDPQGGAFGGIPLRFVGGDGYFGIDALAANDDATLEGLFDQLVAKNTAFPFGTKPTVKSTVIDGVPAFVVLPSKDQPKEAGNEAIFFALYPKQIKIGDNLFKFFILYAHKDYLENILRTLHFDFSAAEVFSENGD